MRKLWLAVAVVGLGLGVALVGCSSKDTGKEKKNGDKMGDKMGGDKMGGDKMEKK